MYGSACKAFGFQIFFEGLGFGFGSFWLKAVCLQNKQVCLEVQIGQIPSCTVARAHPEVHAGTVILRDEIKASHTRRVGI